MRLKTAFVFIALQPHCHSIHSSFNSSSFMALSLVIFLIPKGYHNKRFVNE
jgi:hypothetical protein